MEHCEVIQRCETRFSNNDDADELRKRDEENTTAKSVSPFTLHSTT